jgi:hypothetical protein
MLERLFPRGVAVDAVQSVSAQSSRHAADPRILARIGCTLVSFTLLRPSLEAGIQGQYADIHLPGEGQDNPDDLSAGALARLSGVLDGGTEGEVLVNFPVIAGGSLEPAEAVSHFDRRAMRNDSNRCTGCHLMPPKLQLGQKVLSDGTRPFLALVNPVSGERTAGYCVPRDLELIQACKCGGTRAVAGDCSVLGNGALDHEACARLDALLALGPQQLGAWPPTQNAGRALCLSDSAARPRSGN